MAVDVRGAQPTSVQPDGLPARERLLALVSTSIGTFTSALDYGAVNVALPTISLAFGTSPAQTIWIVTTYQLAITSTLLLFAALGDSLGAKRVYVGALGWCLLTTFGCALSPVLAVLVAMRALQGIATSGIMVMTAPMNRIIYPRRMLGHAIANNSLFVASGNAAGPTIGGLILSVAPWQALFTLNLPLLAIAVAFGLRYLPGGPGTRRPIDGLSVVLGAGGLCTLIFGIQDFARQGAFATALGLVLAGLLVTAIFVHRQLRLPHPLLAVELLRRAPVARSLAAASFCYVAFGAAFVSLPFYLQITLGRTPLQTGLLIAAWPIATVATTRVMGPLTQRHSPVMLATLGMLITAVGLCLFATVPAAPLALIGAAATCGVGFGMFQVTNNYLIISATPPRETGRATGLITTFRTFGNATGAAIVAMLFGTFGVSSAGLWIAALACLCGAAIYGTAAFRRGRRAGRSSEGA